MEKITLRISTWAAKNRRELFTVVLILLLAGFLRLWRISEYMTFLGDEGRDALAVRAMIVEGKFRLIGPVTSIGNMYLGPLYYYLMLPSMVLSGLSPIGPAVMVALFGVATVFLVYYVGREWFGVKAGLIAAILYALSPVVIEHSRTSWNPNIMPFFALLTIFALWRVWQRRQFWWLPIIGVTLSFAIQSHYLGLLLFPTVLIFQGLTFLDILRKRQLIKKFILLSAVCYLLLAILTVAPLVWFDLRHNFINFNAMKEFFTVRQTTVNIKFYKAIPNLWPLWEQVTTRLLGAKQIVVGKWLATALLAAAGLSFFRLWQKRKEKSLQFSALVVLLVWIGVGFFGLGNYKQHIYDHYFGFFFPAPFLIFGWGAAFSWDNFRKLRSLIALGVILILVNFLVWSPLRFPPGRQLERTQKLAGFIIEEAASRPYNLALIAERNYEDAYAYYLTLWGKPPTKIDPQKAKETITGQLFVICEKLPCQPVNHPKAEIAMFGWVKIDQEWDIAGLKIYRLIHSI